MYSCPFYTAFDDTSLCPWGHSRFRNDNGQGTLLYFKTEDRLKLLGEIDIARMCYNVQTDVRWRFHGAFHVAASRFQTEI